MKMENKKIKLIFIFVTVFLTIFFLFGINKNKVSGQMTLINTPIDLQTSSSSGTSCITDNDCPPGVCPNGQMYMSFSCNNHRCFQLNFFVDPCQFLTSSSSGSSENCKCPIEQSFIDNQCKISDSNFACTEIFAPVCGCDGVIYSNSCFANVNGVKEYTDGKCTVSLNKAFTGIWRGKILDCQAGTIDSAQIPQMSECIVCPQIQILCIPGFIKISQSCKECTHCKKCRTLRSILLRLCVKNGKLEGSIRQSGLEGNFVITSQEIIAENEISVTIKNEKGESQAVTLSLTNEKLLSGSFSSGETFQAKKISFGNCRGKNGSYLPCPTGTKCSGLPAYGCYPPGCPVPLCLSPDTRIKTPGIQKRIADIKVGDKVISENGEIVKVKKIVRVEAKKHKILQVTFNDTTVLEVSPGHPIGDGEEFNDLKVGRYLDGRMVIKIKKVPYYYQYTYDILPDSKSGKYYANGILVGSTLK